MTATLTHIRRHPIKSIGAEALDRVALRPAARLSGDREWAVLTEMGERHISPGRWLPKSCFMNGARCAALQAVRGGWQGQSMRLTHPDRPELMFDPALDPDALIDWLHPLWPVDLPAPTRLVRGEWTDVQPPWVSILSLSSLTALEAHLGQTVGIDRWRGNLWVDGWPPFAETDLIGQTLRIGDAELRVTEPIGRCAATSANPQTGHIDIDMPRALTGWRGNHNFGIYAEVLNTAEIALGDVVRS